MIVASRCECPPGPSRRWLYIIKFLVPFLHIPLTVGLVVVNAFAIGSLNPENCNQSPQSNCIGVYAPQSVSEKWLKSQFVQPG